MTAHAIVLPGGAYAVHAPHEAEPVAAWLDGLGLEASVFRYPVGVPHPAPLAALRARIRALRSLGVDRVLLIGFSAGGHLAGHAAYAPLAHPDERVDGVILGYPAVTMREDAHSRSRAVLLGDDPTPAERDALSLELLVAPTSPPTFVWHTADDASVPVGHTHLLTSALAAAGVDHEAHVFARGVHGLGLAAGTSASSWTLLATLWLAERGWLWNPQAPNASEATIRA